MNFGVSISNYHNTGDKPRQDEIGPGRNELGQIAYFCVFCTEHGKYYSQNRSYSTLQ